MKHLGSIRDLSARELRGLLALTHRLWQEYREQGCHEPVLQGQVLAMIFTKPSLRTRVSFEMGMQQLGGHALYINPHEVGLGTRESVPDVARVLSGYVDGIMARVFEHAHIEQLMAHADIPVINGLSDAAHPCQALADMYTIQQVLGGWQDRVLAFIGDGDSNVCRSLLEAGLRLGMEMRVIAPQPYQPAPAFLASLPGPVTVTEDFEAVRGVDVLYTDVWISMGQEADRQERLQQLGEYQVDADLVARSGNRDVIVLHCLPAHRGEEITDDVMDGSHSRVFAQAHNRLHTQKALLAHVMGQVPLPV